MQSGTDTYKHFEQCFQEFIPGSLHRQSSDNAWLLWALQNLPPLICTSQKMWQAENFSNLNNKWEQRAQSKSGILRSQFSTATGPILLKNEAADLLHGISKLNLESGRERETKSPWRRHRNHRYIWKSHRYVWNWKTYAMGEYFRSKNLWAFYCIWKPFAEAVWFLERCSFINIEMHKQNGRQTTILLNCYCIFNPLLVSTPRVLATSTF